MTVVLMLSRTEKNSISKDLETVAEYTGTLRGECSILDPVVNIQLSPTRVNISQCNYMYIPDFKRYYFIKEIKVVRNDMWVISGHVDVLFTYSDYIKAQPAVVSRTGQDDPYIEDDKVTMYSAPDIVTKNFPLAMGERNYLLTVIGAEPRGGIPSGN